MQLDDLKEVEKLSQKLERQLAHRGHIARGVTQIDGKSLKGNNQSVIYNDNSGASKLSEKARKLIGIIILDELDEQIAQTRNALSDYGVSSE